MIDYEKTDKTTVSNSMTLIKFTGLKDKSTKSRLTFKHTNHVFDYVQSYLLDVGRSAAHSAGTISSFTFSL